LILALVEVDYVIVTFIDSRFSVFGRWIVLENPNCTSSRIKLLDGANNGTVPKMVFVSRIYFPTSLDELVSIEKIPDIIELAKLGTFSLISTNKTYPYSSLPNKSSGN